MVDSVQHKFAILFGKLILFAFSSGIRVKITYIVRTAEEQKLFFDQGATNADGYKKTSRHQEGRAIDVVIVKEVNGRDELIWDCPEYAILGNWWRSHGGVWGKDFINKRTGKKLNDIYHFEL